MNYVTVSNQALELQPDAHGLGGLWSVYILTSVRVVKCEVYFKWAEKSIDDVSCISGYAVQDRFRFAKMKYLVTAQLVTMSL